MTIIYLKSALKDVDKIKSQKLISKITQAINNLKKAENLSKIKSLKKTLRFSKCLQNQNRRL